MALTALFSFTVPSDLPSLSFLALLFPSVLVPVGLLERLGVPPPFGVGALEPLVRVLIPVAAVAVSLVVQPFIREHAAGLIKAGA